MGKARVLLLTTTGRRTQRERTTPLIYVREDSSFAVVASNGGSDYDPGWWSNLRANPEAMVQVGRKHFRVRARAASAGERGRLWPMLCAVYPGYATYALRTKRPIPVILLSETPAKP